MAQFLSILHFMAREERRLDCYTGSTWKSMSMRKVVGLLLPIEGRYYGIHQAWLPFEVQLKGALSISLPSLAVPYKRMGQQEHLGLIIHLHPPSESIIEPTLEITCSLGSYALCQCLEQKHVLEHIHIWEGVSFHSVTLVISNTLRWGHDPDFSQEKLPSGLSILKVRA